MCRQWLSRIIGIKYCQFRKSLEKRAQPAHGHLRPGEVHQRRQEEGSSERETRRAGSKQRGRAPPRRSRDREGSRRSPSFLLVAGETTEERARGLGVAEGSRPAAPPTPGAEERRKRGPSGALVRERRPGQGPQGPQLSRDYTPLHDCKTSPGLSRRHGEVYLTSTPFLGGRLEVVPDGVGLRLPGSLSPPAAPPGLGGGQLAGREVHPRHSP